MEVLNDLRCHRWSLTLLSLLTSLHFLSAALPPTAPTVVVLRRFHFEVHCNLFSEPLGFFGGVCKPLTKTSVIFMPFSHESIHISKSCNFSHESIHVSKSCNFPHESIHISNSCHFFPRIYPSCIKFSHRIYLSCI